MSRWSGNGIGLRAPHYADVVAPLRRGENVRVLGLEWLELISENFLEPGGNPRAVLGTVREHFPIALHGVSLSIGSVDPLNPVYLERLGALIEEVEPALVSDHLCWGSVGGCYVHDLLPLPFTEEALVHVAQRVLAVQEQLGRPIAMENVSSYLQYKHSTIREWEFLRELTRRAGCLLLLDVNNVFVSAHNHGFDAKTYIDELPRGSVAQMHLAGHSEHGELYLDTHDAPVREEVWALYRYAVQQHGPVPTCVEWDDDLPSFAGLVAESAHAARVASGACAAGAAHG